MLKKYSSLIVIIILAWMLIISLVVSRQESTTMDEQAHIPSVYTYVKYHDMRLNPEHPPLLKDLAGIPLQFLPVNFPTDDPAWQNGINEQWKLGNEFIHSNNADAITFWSRFPIILLGLLLGYFIYRWTKEIAGTAAGLFALVLYAFDPNILGHNHYVTTDLGIAAFIFIATYYFIKFLKNPSWKNVILAGIFLALAELAKFSAVLLFPLFGLIIIIYALFKRKPASTRDEHDSTRGGPASTLSHRGEPDFTDKKLGRYKLAKLGEYILKYAAAVAICFVVIFALYLFNTWNEPASKIQDIANTVFGNQGMGAISKSVVLKMSSIPLLKGLSEYFLGVFMVFVRVEGGNTYYFFGTVSNHATPWYFPTVFALKETIPFLFLLLFASGYAIYEICKNIISQSGNILKKIWLVIKNYLQTGAVQYSMLGFILLYSYLSITGNLNIGFRHLFPILPFAYVLVSKKIFEFLRNISHDYTKLIFKKVLAVFIIWIILEPVIFFPSYISYFNEAAGGPKNGYKYVTDSNTDWGQDLKRLRNWVEDYNLKKLENLKYPTNSIDKIRVDYFGGSNPKYYFGDKFIPWHGENNPEPGWYAISATFFQESVYKQKKSASPARFDSISSRRARFDSISSRRARFDESRRAGGPGERSYEWLLNYQPTARVGDSIFVYYIP